jgi:hypothetical protein
MRRAVLAPWLVAAIALAALWGTVRLVSLGVGKLVLLPLVAVAVILALRGVAPLMAEGAARRRLERLFAAGPVIVLVVMVVINVGAFARLNRADFSGWQLKWAPDHSLVAQADGNPEPYVRTTRHALLRLRGLVAGRELVYADRNFYPAGQAAVFAGARPRFAAFDDQLSPSDVVTLEPAVAWHQQLQNGEPLVVIAGGPDETAYRVVRLPATGWAIVPEAVYAALKHGEARP